MIFVAGTKLKGEDYVKKKVEKGAECGGLFGG